MGIGPTFLNDNEKGLSVVRLQVAKAYWGVRTLHDAPHIRTVHQVAVFAHRDDTPGIFVPMVPTEHPKPNTSTRACCSLALALKHFKVTPTTIWAASREIQRPHGRHGKLHVLVWQAYPTMELPPISLQSVEPSFSVPTLSLSYTTTRSR